MSPRQSSRRGVVSFVNRGGRMTAGQQRAWDRDWHRLGRAITDLPAGALDLPAWFGREAPTMLEIGSGMGETTSALAAAEPEWNYLAVEVYPPGLAQLLMRVRQGGIENLRLLQGDAVTLLAEHLGTDTLDGARIFFPDPWPKSKHHKRRLVRTEFISLLASRLRAGARLHLATDWQHYAEQMLEVCSAEDSLVNEFGEWAPRPQWRGLTKFEQRAIEEGREVHDLMFRRR
ncbi:MAG: tRNA (guanosine(46)-N7)-methyltransferase TrmB [Sciscionella sp.]